MSQRCFHGVLLLSFCFFRLQAQQPLFHNYSFEQGLKTYNIFKTIQDKYGFIWVVTQDGAYRYNGRQFETFKKNSNSSSTLNGVAFLDVAADCDSSLVFASYNTGIEKISLADLSTEKLDAKLPNLWMKKIYVDSLGTIWVGGKNFLAWKPSTDSSFHVIDSLPQFNQEIEVNFIRQLQWPLLAIGINKYGTLFFDINTKEVIYTLRAGNQYCGSNPCSYFDFIKGDGENIYAITSAGLVEGRIEGNGWMTDRVYEDPVFSKKIFHDFIRDKYGVFWFATTTGLIRYDISSGKSQLFTAAKQKKFSLVDNSILHLMLDDQDNLWLSTSTSLQRMSLHAPSFRYFSGDAVGSDLMEHVYTLKQKTKGQIFATGNDGLYLTNIDHDITTRIPGSESLGRIHHLEDMKDGSWIISADHGLFVYIPDKSVISRDLLLQRYPEWAGWAENYFNQVYTMGHISYWASEEQEGLLKWDRSSKKITQFKFNTERSGGLPENHIHNLCTDRENNLWLLMDNSVCVFDTNMDTITKIFSYNPDSKPGTGLNSAVYFDMYDDGEWLWFGTYGGGVNGLSKKNGQWKYITEREGLSNNCVYSILPENDSIFWVATNSGISRVNPGSASSYNYYLRDGLQDNSFDEKGSLAIGNKIYFGGLNGFTEIDLASVKTRTLDFPVYCFRMEYHYGRESRTINKLHWDTQELPAGTSIISLHLAALSYGNNEMPRFSYRVHGMQDEYVEVDEYNKLTLNTLSYGDYTIEIRYRKDDGSFGGPMNFTFHIRPRWYQQWWFRTLLILAFLALVYGIYLNRVAQIRKEEKMRRKFAGDLHDDIGSTLNSIKIFANHFLTKPGDLGLVRQIKEQTQNAITGVRDLIWVLNDELDTVGDLAHRFGQFADTLANTNNIELKKEIADTVFEMHLKVDLKRNLYLILKESFTNCIKYADADVFGYTFGQGKPGRPRLKICDNGKGFDVQANTEGYGLRNMKERAAQINYHISIHSEPGRGTEIMLSPD